MGLRTASVRRPHVAVMAPALTDTTQTQTFNLPPKSHLDPISPLNNIEEKYLSNGKDLLCKSSKQLNEFLPCNELIVAVDSLHTLALASETLLNNKSLTELSGASDISQNTDIMNNSPSPMGDQRDRMGLQKTGLDTVSNIHKVKSASEVEQFFDNLTGGGDLGQNVEDIMQVIKSIEGCNQNTSNDPNSESDEVFPITGNDLTSFEKELLNDVDVMNMSMEDQPDELDADNLKETQAKDVITDLHLKHAKIERRLDFLRRRVYKLQSRLMGQHISGEIAGVFEHVHRSIKRLKDIHDTPKDPSGSTSSPLIDPNGLDRDKPKPMSYGSTKALIRKLEMTSILQANSASRHKHVPKYFGSGSIEPPTFRSSITGMVNVPPWSIENKNELQKVTGLLKTELSIVQKEVDSDVTESSSGGESCDEMQNYHNPHQQYLSIQKRALWKYSTDRAAIAARWTWLQAQISDLEYRIRQHTELHKQIRTGKGPVTLGGPSPPPNVPSPPPSPSLPVSPTAINGYKGQLPGNSPISASKQGDSGTANGAVWDYQCVRTRPLVNFKKRKLLQTAGLHAISKKAARPSSIRCGCVPLSVPCALCTGRTDPTHPRDPPETLSKSERISLLDPSYHPVFSLPEDASQSIHLEAIMKTSEWQQRSTRMKTLKVLSRVEKIDKSLEHRSKKLEHRKKYGRLLKPSTMSALSAKIKNKIRGKKGNRHPLNRLNRKRHTAKVAIAQLQALAAEGVDEEVESIGNNGNMASRSLDSPSSSPLLQMQSISGYNRKNRIHSYDIDNIVIPYSVAASTRVEKLQYKEILTPKWRIADPDFGAKYEAKNNGIVHNPSQEEDVEDISEEAIVARHDRCEHDEKKKFLSYLKLPVGYGRSRSHKRTDSRAESSGANTPDPMSPHPIENNDINSPIASPPDTPLPLIMEDSTPLPSVSLMRRRTISQSRFVKDKEIKEESSSLPDIIEILPYEMRIFPLSEETYEKMLKHMPEDHQLKTNIRSQDSDFVCSESYLDEKIDSPGSESTESALGDEDPNDPEWIDMERSRDRHKR